MTFSQHKILIVEDEVTIAKTLKLNLELHHYQVKISDNGTLAIADNIAFKPNLILLDVMLPNISGYDLYPQLKASKHKPAIIFLTAKNQIHHKIKGLELGADDYISKPFDLDELMLRIKNVLYRMLPVNLIKEFEFENCKINFENYTATTNRLEQIALSKKEIKLLHLLIDKANTVVSRDEIIDYVWNNAANPSSRTIDNFILSFRKWFEKNPKHPKHFISIRGVGYKFVL